MNSLILILKEILKEFGDSTKLFHFIRNGDHVKKQIDSNLLIGSVYYEFKTEVNLEYEVKLAYFGEGNSMYNLVDEDYSSESENNQMVEVSFYINRGRKDDNVESGFFSTTNNTKELYSVMGTIFDCLKDAIKIHPAKWFAYQSVNTKGSGRDPKGKDQRNKLYEYYVKKVFPRAKIDQEGKYVIVTIL